MIVAAVHKLNETRDLRFANCRLTIHSSYCGNRSTVRSASHLLRGLKPGPLEDEISIFERRGTVQSVVRHVIVRVEHAELPGRQHVLVPTLQTCVDIYLDMSS